MMNVTIPSHRLVAEGIRNFAKDQWVAWKAAREKQGVVSGPLAIPEKTHPDIALLWDQLPEGTRDWITMLVFQRMLQFKSLAAEQLAMLLSAGNGESELDASLKETLAIGLHDGWWTLRRMLGRSGHAGDKPWTEESDAEKANDLCLVPPFAQLLAAYDASADPEKIDLLAFIRNEQL